MNILIFHTLKNWEETTKYFHFLLMHFLNFFHIFFIFFILIFNIIFQKMDNLRRIRSGRNFPFLGGWGSVIPAGSPELELVQGSSWVKLPLSELEDKDETTNFGFISCRSLKISWNSSSYRNSFLSFPDLAWSVWCLLYALSCVFHLPSTWATVNSVLKHLFNSSVISSHSAFFLVSGW